MANNMSLVVKESFQKANIVIYRSHVHKLAGYTVQNIRIKHRLQEIEDAKQDGYKHKPIVFHNGDTMKQLLARSRYLLFKPESRWTRSQLERSDILFKHYPDIKKAYNISQKLSYIYENNTAAESFNAKIKSLELSLKGGGQDLEFFLFRLAKYLLS